MRAAIIINTDNNISLLRFTETKLFFDAKNQNRGYFTDCFVVESRQKADQVIAANKQFDTFFILKTGYFLTSSLLNFRKLDAGIIEIDEDDPLIILYDPDTQIDFKQRCKYPPKSKQLYIVENMLKSIIAARKTIYFENTENFEITEQYKNIKHVCGLASGWKTPWLVKQIGKENIESVTVFDINPTQLEYAKYLHSCTELPTEIKDMPDFIKHSKNSVGKYKKPDWVNDWWQEWHSIPVTFKQLDLLTAPKFQDQSLIWVSNVFEFEPTIFEYGWNFIKTANNRLIETNKQSIILKS